MATKRERCANWSLTEISVLTDFVEKNEETLKAKQCNQITNSKKNAMWAEVTAMINAIGVQKRTVEQVKFKWGNLQQGAKKSFSEARKQSKLTGGGPPPKPLTAAEEKIIEMMKDRPNFSGIVGGFESSVPAFAVVSKETESEAASTSTHGTNEERTEADIDVNEVQSSECTYPERTNAEKESEFECCSERDQSPSVTKPKKRKRITLDVLQTMQYEVLRTQRRQLELKSMKLERDIERADLEKENMKLQNEKLLLEIEIMKQSVSQNENALLALQVISDE
ncbi:uncharacterized protein LOC133203627 [Saccostrea echinata]|uniref:uncharacterized protein LOC133176317 n=1 Tax=Saccostrea echinata TaxID=191078 RepID=UPI002A7FEE80|nr:uncharacterized protein LOC133176317 [Saccostrea echinata]XP_061195354.1 uncharacterized protein LOC133203601 [Saccostrea echinata]XP_061195384.1 uncharacterized protein LOC133203627 [Saccostrea echinata]